MRLSCDVRLEDPDMTTPTISKNKISPELLQKFQHNLFIKYERENEYDHKISTQQTLAPNYNEVTQMTDFLKAINELCNQIDPSTIPAVEGSV
tara:strand:+ start:254 stop:532 length:279 start_codon:yes stop_codon:yes gene_type:complete